MWEDIFTSRTCPSKHCEKSYLRWCQILNWQYQYPQCIVTWPLENTKRGIRYYTICLSTSFGYSVFGMQFTKPKINEKMMVNERMMVNVHFYNGYRILRTYGNEKQNTLSTRRLSTFIYSQVVLSKREQQMTYYVIGWFILQSTK